MTSTTLKYASKLLAYGSCSTMVVGSLWYDEMHIVNPFNKNRFCGKWQFLTHWTMYVMAIYWTLAFIAGLVHRSYDERDGFIHRLVDYIHASIAFPMGMSVCFLFWSLYAVDRELVYPKALDDVFPPWLNHVMHTSYIPCLLVDKYLVLHTYPKKSHGLPLLLVIPIIYQLWILYLAFAKDVWVYPVLAVLNWPLRIVFFLLSWFLLACVYTLGSIVTNHAWGGEPIAKKAKVL